MAFSVFATIKRYEPTKDPYQQTITLPYALLLYLGSTYSLQWSEYLFVLLLGTGKLLHTYLKFSFSEKATKMCAMVLTFT